MAPFEELKVLQVAEGIADEMWSQVTRWETFARDVVGGQLCRAADSIGANIAEAFGRYHFGEKLQFLYYARGSLFETKYWINRTWKRHLVVEEIAKQQGEKLSGLAKDLNALALGWKRMKQSSAKPVRNVREAREIYSVEKVADIDELSELNELLFEKEHMDWLQQLTEADIQQLAAWGVTITDDSPITNNQ